ncbi:MAG: hypothetical protein JRI75_02230 [Deltaproteobacteria bacterium]|nr:hypothetical protein [Deltaproteobacteria bacterium]
MNRTFTLITSLVVISLLFFLSCAPSKLTSTWKSDTYTGGPLKNVMIIGITENVKNRKVFETAFTNTFIKNGVQAIPSYTVIPDIKDINEERVVSEAEKKEINAVFVTHVLGLKAEEVFYKPLGYDPRSQYRPTVGNYINVAKDYVTSPMQYTQVEEVQLESLLFDRETQEMIWSVSSDTYRPDSVKEVIDRLATNVMKSLRESQLIK